MRLRELLTAIENVSRGKNTTQSDTWRNGTSDKAVDGDYSTTDLDRCATILSNRATRSLPFNVAWKVNLGGLYAIVSVTIYNTAVVPGITTVGLQTVCRFCYFDFLFFFRTVATFRRKLQTFNAQTQAAALWPQINQRGYFTGLAVWCSGNALVSINAVALHRARLVLGWVTCLRAGKLSHYITSHPGQLSLSSFRGR